jgi:hypothetical protein
LMVGERLGEGTPTENLFWLENLVYWQPLDKDDWNVSLTRTLTHAYSLAHLLTIIGIIRLLLLAELRQSTRLQGEVGGRRMGARAMKQSEGNLVTGLRSRSWRAEKKSIWTILMNVHILLGESKFQIGK